MHKQARLVVLASGSGTNLQAIIDACKSGKLSAEVCAVISDQNDAFALQRAKNNDIPTIHHDWSKYKSEKKSRAEYDIDLAALTKGFQPDLIILAGWMRLLSLSFLSELPNKVINLHPALPNTFPGTHAINKAYQAFINGDIQETGVMVHYVPDEGVDNGPVILQETVPIYSDDDLETLEQRIHEVEHQILVRAIKQTITPTS